MENDRRSTLNRVSPAIESGETRARRAAELRAERGKRNLSNAALGRGSGLTPKRVAAILRGEKVYVHELEAICSFLDVSVSEFLERTRDAA